MAARVLQALFKHDFTWGRDACASTAGAGILLFWSGNSPSGSLPGQRS